MQDRTNMWHELVISRRYATLVFETHFIAFHHKSCFMMKCNELFSSLLMKTKVTNGPYSYLMRKTAPFEELFDAPGRGYNLQH